MAYGMAPPISTASRPPSAPVRSPGRCRLCRRVLPCPGRGRCGCLWGSTAWGLVPTQALARQGDAQPMATADSAPEQATLILSATAAGGGIAGLSSGGAGRNPWRIASQLQSKEAGGSDTLQLSLALVRKIVTGWPKGSRYRPGSASLPESADSGAIRFPEPGPATAAVCPSGAGGARGWREAWWVPLGQERSDAGSFLVSPPGPC